MSNKSESSESSGCWTLLLLILLGSQSWFWAIVGIIAIILIPLAIVGNLIPTEQSSSNTQQSSNNEANNTQSSSNASSENIQWTDISTSEASDTVVFNDEFLGKNQNNNLNEHLINLIGQKDQVTREMFRAGEKVYFCVNCQLGYHEDSWQSLERKCNQCKSSKFMLIKII